MTATVKPAHIKNVIITRSKQGNEELSGRLKRAGFHSIPVDTISLSAPEDWAEVDRLLRRLHSFDWLVFTSATGVEYFERRMRALSLPLGWSGKPLVASVGQRTGERLLALGIKPSFVPSSFLTETLAVEIPTDRGHRVLLLRADIADPKLSRDLRERGFGVDEASIYATRLLDEKTGANLMDADAVVFASPSAVRGFCRIVPNDQLSVLRRVRALCIGPVTAMAARQNGFVETIVPKTYTLASVVDELLRLNEQDE